MAGVKPPPGSAVAVRRAADRRRPRSGGCGAGASGAGRGRYARRGRGAEGGPAQVTVAADDGGAVVNREAPGDPGRTRDAGLGPCPPGRWGRAGGPYGRPACRGGPQGRRSTASPVTGRRRGEPAE